LTRSELNHHPVSAVGGMSVVEGRAGIKDCGSMTSTGARPGWWSILWREEDADRLVDTQKF
jgi:hypothetical protein